MRSGLAGPLVIHLSPTGEGPRHSARTRSPHPDRIFDVLRPLPDDGRAIAYGVHDAAAVAVGFLSRLRGRAGGGCLRIGIVEDAPEWRKPSPAALCERVGLSRKQAGEAEQARGPRDSICDCLPTTGRGRSTPECPSIQSNRASGALRDHPHCNGGSPLVRFLARSISVTAIRISARVFRSGASSMACFSAGP